MVKKSACRFVRENPWSQKIKIDGNQISEILLHRFSQNEFSGRTDPASFDKCGVRRCQCAYWDINKIKGLGPDKFYVTH